MPVYPGPQLLDLGSQLPDLLRLADRLGLFVRDRLIVDTFRRMAMGAAGMTRLHAVALWISVSASGDHLIVVLLSGRYLRGRTHLDLAQATHSAGPWLAVGKPLRERLDG